LSSSVKSGQCSRMLLSGLFTFMDDGNDHPVSDLFRKLQDFQITPADRLQFPVVAQVNRAGADLLVGLLSAKLFEV
jgi:hypothetical protein